MLNSRRIASARPDEAGALRKVRHDLPPVARAREIGHAVLDGFKQHDLLTYSSAISFQILTAVIPFVLFVLAVAGLLHVTSVWRDHLAPEIKANVTPAVFAVLSTGVHKVFTGQRVLWTTLGGGLALWQVSGAVRAVMGAMGRIYGAGGERPFVRRYSISFVLSIEVGACFILAALCLLLAPFVSVAHAAGVWQVGGFVVRWGLAVALLLLAVGLLVRHAPGTHQTLQWVSFGAGVVIVAWLLTSVLFYLYVTDLGSYDSVFGSLAVLIVAMAYLYVSTTVFLFGAQLDAILRGQSTGTLSGVSVDPATPGPAEPQHSGEELRDQPSEGQ